jgi:NodT family efflux transporter outer membrane factor (OMF) lipoprotein
VGPDFLRPKPPETPSYTTASLTTMPEAGGETRQHVAEGKPVAPEWWKSFASPELDEVVALAIADSPTLEASRATLAAARERIVSVRGGLFPQVDLNASAGRAKARGTSSSRGTIANAYAVGATVDFDTDIFGGIKRSVELQSALADFQRYELAAAYLALTGNVVTQAITIASIRAQIDQVNALIALDRRTVELTRASFEGGRSARTDVLQAESQLTADLTLLPPLNQALAVARHALAVLTGRAPGDWTPPDFDLDKLTTPEELPLTVPSQLVHERPDILAAEATLHASSAAVGVATANLYPNLSLSGTWSRVASTPDSLFNPASMIWSIAAGLAQPLFHGGTLTAERRAAVEDFNADLATYRDTVLTSFGQVADVLRSLEHDAQFLQANRTALETAQASADLQEESYRVGQASLLQVIDAQRLLFQARLAYVRARANRLQDTTQLYLSMGGAWGEYEPTAPHEDGLFAGIRGP